MQGKDVVLDMATTKKQLLKLQVMLEQSIKLQAQIVAKQAGLDFDQFHKEILKGIDKQVMKLLEKLPDNQ